MTLPSGMPQTLCGMPVYIVPESRQQYRFPRSKKRRIQKKWAKQTPRNLARYFRVACVLKKGQVLKCHEDNLMFPSNMQDWRLGYNGMRSRPYLIMRGDDFRTMQKRIDIMERA